MPEYNARRVSLWLLIAKNGKGRLALHTTRRKVYHRRQLLPKVACSALLLIANNNGAAVLSSGLDVSNDFESSADGSLPPTSGIFNYVTFI